MKRWWSLFKEAVRGSDRDYTVGPVGSALVLLSVPMVLEMAMESLFAVVDVFFVSRVSANAVATVGVTESMLTIVYTVAMGLGIGATAVVARRMGEKDDEGAAQAAAQAIALGVVMSITIGVIGWFNAERLLRVMGATPAMIESSLGYTQVMFAGNATVTLLFLNNAIFRGAGDPAIAMRVLWIGNAINLVLDPCLIFGWGPFPELGVTGSAIATTIGRGVAVGYQLWRLFGGTSRVPVITTTSTANVGVSESVSYLDVGLKLDVEPNVFLDNEVGVKVTLEVSNIVREVKSRSGTLTYQIGTRLAATNLRLRDGETQALAGLISDEDRKGIVGAPGAVDLPVLGRLFSSERSDNSKTEIVLLITPRVVRNIGGGAPNRYEYASGTETAVGAPSLRMRGPGRVAQAPSSAGGRPVNPVAASAPEPAPPPAEAAPPAPVPVAPPVPAVPAVPSVPVPAPSR